MYKCTAARPRSPRRLNNNRAWFASFFPVHSGHSTSHSTGLRLPRDQEGHTRAQRDREREKRDFCLLLLVANPLFQLALSLSYTLRLRVWCVLFSATLKSTRGATHLQPGGPHHEYRPQPRPVPVPRPACAANRCQLTDILPPPPPPPPPPAGLSSFTTQNHDYPRLRNSSLTSHRVFFNLLFLTFWAVRKGRPSKAQQSKSLPFRLCTGAPSLT